MLFHVTMTHTPENCPAYHIENMPEVLTSFENLEAVGKDLHVKPIALLWGAPDHIAFAVLEADSLSAVGRFLSSIKIKQEFKVTPVQNLHEVVEYGKAAIANAKK